MIGDIEAKRVNMVITKDLSRLARDYIMTSHYMERYFGKKGAVYLHCWTASIQAWNLQPMTLLRSVPS